MAARRPKRSQAQARISSDLWPENFRSSAAASSAVTFWETASSSFCILPSSFAAAASEDRSSFASFAGTAWERVTSSFLLLPLLLWQQNALAKIPKPLPSDSFAAKLSEQGAQFFDQLLILDTLFE